MFRMYNPNSDSILVNLQNKLTVALSFKKCNSNVILSEPYNIIFLYELAERNPLTYAKLALKENGLQDYVDALEKFN